MLFRSISGNAATANTASNFSGTLSGDVTGTQNATVVSKVGGETAANVASGAQAANQASAANTANAIVKRDASGNFAAGTITAALNGNASTATTATNFSGTLTGDVTGTQGATSVAALQGKAISNATPADGQVLKYNATAQRWEPAVDNSSGGTVTNVDRKSTRLNSSHIQKSRMPSSA